MTITLGSLSIESQALESSSRNVGQKLVKFPTFIDAFQRLPEEAKFQINYELHVRRKPNEEYLKFQVRELNLGANKLGQMKVWSQEALAVGLQFWFANQSSGRIKMVEFESARVCKLAPSAVSTFGLDKLHATSRRLPSPETFSFLVADLWHQIGDAMRAEAKLSTETEIQAADEMHLLNWTLLDDTDQSSVSFKFEKRTVKNRTSLSLNSIWISSNKKLDAVELRAVITYVGPLLVEDSTKAFTELPFHCKQARSTSRAQFPSLSSLLGAGSTILHLRSEVQLGWNAPGSLFAPTKIYQLNEWLDFRDLDDSKDGSRKVAKYRAKLLDSTRNPVRAWEYLADEQFFELFRLEDECKNFHSKKSDLSYPAGEWIFAHLLDLAKSDEQNFKFVHLPAAIWSLASGENNRKVERSQISELGVELLLGGEELTTWFNRQVWLVESSELNLSARMYFNVPPNYGHQSRELYRMEVGSFVQNDCGPRIVVDLLSVQFLKRKEGNSGLEDNFMIPKGLGCKRSETANRILSEFGPSDVIVFEKSIPVEFNYVANLELQVNGTLQPTGCVLSGWFGQCPANWNMMRIGRFQVNEQHRHYLDGRVQVTRQVLDDFSTRTIDQLGGGCDIVGLNGGEHGRGTNLNQVFRLDFGSPAGELAIPSKFLSLIDHQMIQRIDLESSRKKIVYELRVDSIQLSPELSGSGSIVKTFLRESNFSGPFYYHTKFLLEIFIHKKAYLAVQLDDLRFRECLSIVKEAKLADCLKHRESDSPNRLRLRKFELDFKLMDQRMRQQVDASRLRGPMETNSWNLMQKLMALLVSPKLALPPTQIANEPQLGWRKTDFEIFAELELLEPLEMVHTFERLIGKRVRRARQLTDSITLRESAYRCSNLCESAPSKLCFAFNYCSDGTCHLLKRPPEQSNKSNDTLEFLATNLEDEPECSLYYAPSLFVENRQSIDEMVARIRSQIDSNSSDISLKLPLTGGTWLNLVAADIRELGGQFARQKSSRGNKQREYNFVTFEPGARLELTHEENRESSKGGSRPLVRTEHVQDETHCLELCERHNCRLGSFCSSSQMCSLVSNLNSWQQMRFILNKVERNHSDCLIFSQDFLANYNAFDLDKEPKKFQAQMSGFSQQECAAICSMRDAIESGTGPTDCLSFDYCLNPFNGQRVCYLNRMHLIMEEFDRKFSGRLDAISVDSKRADGLGAKASFGAPACRHFARSIVSDFELFASNKKFSHRNSVVFNPIELDKCALICKRDESCLAFEFCALKATCYIKRTDTELAQSTNSSNLATFGHSDLVDADKNLEQCSIYRLERLDDCLEELIMDRPRPQPPLINPLDFEHLILWPLVALLAGAAISIALFRLLSKR